MTLNWIIWWCCSIQCPSECTKTLKNKSLLEWNSEKSLLPYWQLKWWIVLQEQWKWQGGGTGPHFAPLRRQQIINSIVLTDYLNQFVISKGLQIVDTMGGLGVIYFPSKACTLLICEWFLLLSYSIVYKVLLFVKWDILSHLDICYSFLGLGMGTRVICLYH